MKAGGLFAGVMPKCFQFHWIGNSIHGKTVTTNRWFQCVSDTDLFLRISSFAEESFHWSRGFSPIFCRSNQLNWNFIRKHKILLDFETILAGCLAKCEFFILFVKCPQENHSHVIFPRKDYRRIRKTAIKAEVEESMWLDGKLFDLSLRIRSELPSYFSVRKILRIKQMREFRKSLCSEIFIFS